jgi:pimeloyl-ACP methyl ester carboxylesterase
MRIRSSRVLARGQTLAAALGATLAVALPAIAAPQSSAAGAAARTVEITLDGRPTRADLHLPPRPSAAAVVLAHGFLRSRATMTSHAAALAADGVLAVAPDLPYLTDSRKNARALADLVGQLRAGGLAPAVDRVVLVGFSAGGLAALLAADTPGVVGYVGLDAFDRPGGLGRDAAARLATPARLLRAPPSFCNAYGISTPWIGALRNLIADQVLEGTSHCDFEAPTDGLCEAVCGTADPARQAVVRQVLREAVRDWLLQPRTLPAVAPSARADTPAPGTVRR